MEQILNYDNSYAESLRTLSRFCKGHRGNSVPDGRSSERQCEGHVGHAFVPSIVCDASLVGAEARRESEQIIANVFIIIEPSIRPRSCSIPCEQLPCIACSNGGIFS